MSVRCKIPQCGVTLERGARIPLCASCRYVARWAFAAGAFLAGVAVGVVRALK